MKEKVINELKEIEKENDITVIYACESGSRSWGLNHEKSDYDVRFIFKRNKLEDYLCIDEKADVINRTKDSLDIVGWDIKKALRLHYKSNADLREWLISKEVYIPLEKDYFKGLPDFDKILLKKHYTGIICSDLVKKGKGKDDRKYKRRLYDVRGILACKAINQGLSPEIIMVDLIEQIELDKTLKEKILQMIKDHKSRKEKIDEEDLNYMDKFIEESYNVLSAENKKAVPEKRDKELYDKRFFDIVTGKL